MSHIPSPHANLRPCPFLGHPSEDWNTDAPRTGPCLCTRGNLLLSAKKLSGSCCACYHTCPQDIPRLCAAAVCHRYLGFQPLSPLRSLTRLRVSRPAWALQNGRLGFAHLYTQLAAPLGGARTTPQLFGGLQLFLSPTKARACMLTALPQPCC